MFIKFFSHLFKESSKIMPLHLTMNEEGEIVDAYSYYSNFMSEQADVERQRLHKELLKIQERPILFDKGDARRNTTSLLHLLNRIHPDQKQNVENNLTHEPKTL